MAWCRPSTKQGVIIFKQALHTFEALKWGPFKIAWNLSNSISNGLLTYKLTRMQLEDIYIHSKVTKQHKHQWIKLTVVSEPQGSILRPLLFRIYVNDLTTSSRHAIAIFFAEDWNLIYKRAAYDGLKVTTKDDLAKISDWHKANTIALNESKTKLMIFHTQFNKPPKNFQIISNSIDLERVENTISFRRHRKICIYTTYAIRCRQLVPC